MKIRISEDKNLFVSAKVEFQTWYYLKLKEKYSQKKIILIEIDRMKYHIKIYFKGKV